MLWPLHSAAICRSCMRSLCWAPALARSRKTPTSPPGTVGGRFGPMGSESAEAGVNEFMTPFLTAFRCPVQVGLLEHGRLFACKGCAFHPTHRLNAEPRRSRSSKVFEGPKRLGALGYQCSLSSHGYGNSVSPNRPYQRFLPRSSRW